MAGEKDNRKKKFNKFAQVMSYLKRDIISNTHPVVFQVESTNHCPMRCIMCPRTTKMERELGYMDFDLFKKIVDEAKQYTKLLRLHHFGDPLLHPQIHEFIDYCYEKGVETSISVNPILLSDKMIEKILSSKLDNIQISIDGLDDCSYKAIRGPAADYEKAIKAVENLARRKIELGKNKPKILIGMVLLKATEDKLQEFKDKWNSIPGVDRVLIKAFSTMAGGVDIDLGDTKGQEQLKNNPKKYPCKLPWKSIVVLFDGRVVPCCYDFEGGYILGDLNNQTVEEVWNGEKMQELRKQHITNKFGDNEMCKNCPDRYGSPGFNQPIKFTAYMIKRLIRSEKEPKGLE